jgi:pSer/pThr/pTyr-binding forkhead associated (FHA) protein
MLALQLLRIAENATPAFTIQRFPCVVGRHSTCDRRLNDPEISRRHCTFWLREGRVWVEDLGSLNGTRLNGKPLEGTQPLAEGDLLDVGPFSFRVHLTEVVAEETVDLEAPPLDADDPTGRNLA